MGVPLLAATGPIVLIGLGLMLYNALRFNNPFEFGQHYQLHAERQMARHFFSLQYLWFNFRVYFLEPVRWTTHSPFVRGIVMPPVPPGHSVPERPFGVLTTIPFVWLALAAPLAWRGRSEPAGGVLRWFVTAVALLSGICALTVGLFYGACARYEVDFLPTLVLLAVVGILSVERALTDRPVRRRALRWGWGLLLGFSVAFNLLAGVEHSAELQTALGNQLLQAGNVSEAFEHYQQALRIDPDYANAHESLGNALVQLGRLPEANVQYQQALRIKPDDPETHYNLGTAFTLEGKTSDAIGQYEQALRVKPDFAEAHYNCGVALEQVGRVPEAIAHYKEALRIKPDLAEAHNNLGAALAHTGRVEEAIAHFEQALRIKPDFAEAHYNYGVALEQVGRVPDAIPHYEEALRINPGLAEARTALARLQAGQ